jgi:hypothetical protein
LFLEFLRSVHIVPEVNHLQNGKNKPWWELFYKALPLGLFAIAAAGFFCFSAIAPDEFLHRRSARMLTLGGWASTLVILLLIWRIRLRASSWKFCGLSKRLVIIIIYLSWLSGALGGITVFLLIPKAFGFNLQMPNRLSNRIASIENSGDLLGRVGVLPDDQSH